MRTTSTCLILLTLALFSGCSAHSPFILKNTVDIAQSEQASLPAHSRSVFVTKERLNPGKYDVVAFIDVGRAWYGSSSKILLSMAEQARELGADAVVEVKVWRQPSGFAWAAPHGSGKAVKFKSKGTADLSRVRGDWL